MQTFVLGLGDNNSSISCFYKNKLFDANVLFLIDSYTTENYAKEHRQCIYGSITTEKIQGILFDMKKDKLNQYDIIVIEKNNYPFSEYNSIYKYYIFYNNTFSEVESPYEICKMVKNIILYDRPYINEHHWENISWTFLNMQFWIKPVKAMLRNLTEYVCRHNKILYYTWFIDRKYVKHYILIYSLNPVRFLSKCMSMTVIPVINNLYNACYDQCGVEFCENLTCSSILILKDETVQEQLLLEYKPITH